MPLIIDFWNVAQGDCTVITLPTGELIIIDVGPKGSPLVDYLNDRPKSIYAVVLTHNDADHAGALPSLVHEQRSRIDNFFMLRDRPVHDPRFQKLFRAALQGEADGHYVITRLQKGAEIWKDDALKARLVTVYPGFSASILAANPNEASGIICLEVNGKVLVIWPGDSMIGRVAAECGRAKPFVLHGPHHGAPSDFRSRESLAAIQELEPMRAFISVGTTNRYSHPRAKYIRRLGRTRCHVVCSQLTSRCDRLTTQRGDHVLQAEALLGLRPPRRGTSCRGAWRLELHGDTLVPDKWDAEHMSRIARLRRPQCLYGRGWRKGSPLPPAVAN
jgi:beta-lactamase superfamily II metal-dependent hydrolase